MWYVVQVLAGQERLTLDLFKRFASPSSYKEAFIPQREVMRHRTGDWVSEKEILFPGYLFIVTRHPVKLSEQLASVPAFTRLLGSDTAFVPLADEEQRVITGLVGKGRVVAMSEAIDEGDEVRILRGPLRDLAVPIEKIDRHKRAAYIRISMLGRESVVKVGLEVLRKTR